MSKFKVGDKVVYISSEVEFFDDSEIHTVSLVTENGLYKVQGLYFSRKALRLATPEELALGKRLDDIKIQVSYGIKLNDLGVVTMGFDPGKDITHELGDDSHMENHISPNCKSKDV